MDSTLLALIMKLKNDAVTKPLYDGECLIPTYDSGCLVWSQLSDDSIGSAYILLNYNNSSFQVRDVPIDLLQKYTLFPCLSLNILPTLDMFSTLLLSGTVSAYWGSPDSKAEIFNAVSVRYYNNVTIGYTPDAYAVLQFYGADENYARFAGKFHVEGYSAMGVPDGDYPMVLLYDFDTNEFTIQCNLGGT